MGARGKAPTPTKLRLLHGETRPSRINYNEPQPASMEPECPDYFTPDAREVWDRVVVQLRAMDLLAAADQDMLAAYCQAVAKYQKAVRMIESFAHRPDHYKRKVDAILTHAGVAPVNACALLAELVDEVKALLSAT